MKIGFLALILLASSIVVTNAQSWTLDKSHSGVGFSVTHLMLSEVDGTFKDFEASLTSSKDDLSDAVFEFKAQIASVDTRNERRDNHLKAADFFEAEKYPTLSFKSTSFKKVEGKKWKLTGNLTIKGVTKPVTLDVTLNGPIENQRSKKPMIGLKASATIDRYDFGVGGESGAAQSREVEIRVNGEFTKN
jgi:polyisoprenoid-binding protein YceI